MTFAGVLELALVAGGVAMLIVRHNDLSAATVNRIWLGVAIGVLVGAIPAFVRWWGTQLSLTESQLVIVQRRLRLRRHAWPFSQLVQVRVSSSPLGARLNYGTVQVEGSDGRRVVVMHVAHADALGAALRPHLGKKLRGR